MTDVQLEQFKKEHRGEDYNSPTQRKISCISMVNSILAYHWTDKNSNAKELLDWELQSRYHSYLKQYVDELGYDTVLSIIEAQMNDIEDIRVNVYRDNEGVTYNSIIWKN